MKAITVNELIEKLQAFVVEDESNNTLPCFIFPEGGQDILVESEVEILEPTRDKAAQRDIPKRLQLG